MEQNMKAKLSALTLALLPLLANASIELSSVKNLTYKSDSVIVVYKNSASQFDRRAARNLVQAKISDLNNDEIDDKYRNLNKGRIAKFSLNSKMSVKNALKELRKNSAVLYAEPNYIVHASLIPDDSSFSDLWGMNNTGQAGGVVDADIDAPEAWDISTGSHDVILGVIDTGVDHTHPDLMANIWTNPGEIAGDGIDNDGNGYIDDMHGINATTSVGDPMDDNGHGSHVSGTIGATGNNGLGVVGVNHSVSIIGCKFLDSEGSGSLADALTCIDYFVDLKNNGVNVRATNNSWGGGGFSQALSDAITTSEEANILFVAAAGNDAYDNDVQNSYPSGYPQDSVLAVASTTRTDSMSSFSQWGLNTVDLGAPGSSILSTVPGGGYASYSGTSMATPHVVGAAALAWSVNPELSAIEMKELLMSSGDENSALAGKTVSGKRLNVKNALDDADPTPGFTLNPIPSSSTIEAGETASFSFDVGSVADWNGEVSLTLDDPLGGATLSTDTATPGLTFELSVPTTAETQWGEYTFAVTGTSDDLVKTSTVRLMVNPQGLNEFTYTNDTIVNIPDNDATGITSIINVADELTVFASDIYVNITHTWIGDLTLMLTSPAGTSAVLHNASGGNNDNIDTTFSSSAFNGEVTTGDWILSVADNAAADTGSLNNWALTITGIGEVLPSAPEASFAYDADGLTATFTDSSNDRNNDMVSWDWNFGDGAISSEQNPVHTFAETGNYDVTLTVTDSEGLNSSETMLVSVSSVSIEAAVKRAYKSRLGRLRVDITWDGSSADTVDIFRNGIKIDTVENIGIYRDRERRTEGSQFIYQICDETTACSNEVTANF
jgi:serine protease